MTEVLLHRRDMNFLLHEWLDADALADRDTVDAVIDLSEKLAADAFLKHYKRADGRSRGSSTARC